MLKLLVGVEYHNMLLVRMAVVPYIVYKYLYLQEGWYKYLYEQGGKGGSKGRDISSTFL